MELFFAYLISVSYSLLKYFIFAGIPFLIVYKLFSTRFHKAKIQQRTAKRKDFLREILYSIQSSLLFVMVVLAFTGTPLVEFTKIYLSPSDYPIWWMPVSLILMLIVHDTYFYWMHRFMHLPALFKTVHAVHHKSVVPSPWATKAFHALEALLEIMIVPIILFLLPVHLFVLLAFSICVMLINVYGHLGYEIMPKWFRHTWAFEILNTSVHHNLHHSKFKGNYGLYFRFWDRVMKTENPNYVNEYDKIQVKRFGQFVQVNQTEITTNETEAVLQ
ncbi:MAG: sterol desaturase family protein [Sphingobacteriales bacterium]|nr:MAG: sterol desaturase family protein [Sphingobacteriales bacterium]